MREALKFDDFFPLRVEEEDEKTTMKTVNKFGAVKTDQPMLTEKNDNQNSSLSDDELVNVTQGSESIGVPQNQSNQLNQSTKHNQNGIKQIENREENFQNGEVDIPAMKRKRKGDEDDECLICVDGEAEVVFEPCGHCTMCEGKDFHVNLFLSPLEWRTGDGARLPFKIAQGI